MGALAPLSSWSSEDDQLLKNAIEAGKSLESIGKGAVQFSRRFTFQELKDRWHSLTYHANTLVEPSPHIIECVDSALTLPPKSHILEYKGEKSVLKRRLNDSAQDCYNAMLKRVKSSVVESGDSPQSTEYMYEEAKSNCDSVHQHLPNLETVSAAAAAAATPNNVTESCNSFDAYPHCEPQIHKSEEDSHSVTKEADQPSNRSMFKLNDAFCCETETPVKFDQTCLTYADSDFRNSKVSSTLPQIPIANPYESISEPALSEHQVEENERNAANSADFYNDGDSIICEFSSRDVYSDAMDHIPCHNIENLAPSTDGHLAGSSDCCLSFKELEEFLFTDIDGKDTANIPDLDSFLLDFTWEENVKNVEHSSIPVGGACSGDYVNDVQHMTCSAEAQMLPFFPSAKDPDLHITGEPESQLSHSVLAAIPELHIPCVPEAEILPSKPNVVPDHPELCNGVICCVLNTEDREIPCNDDALITLSSTRPQPASSSRKNHQVRGPKAMNRAENNNEKRSSPCQMIQSQILSDLGINLPFINSGA